MKVVTQSAIYSIWRQRNSADNNNGHASTRIIFKTIDRDVLTQSRRESIGDTSILSRNYGFGDL